MPSKPPPDEMVPKEEAHPPLIVWIFGDVPQRLVDELYRCLDALYRAEGGSGLKITRHGTIVQGYPPERMGLGGEEIGA